MNTTNTQDTATKTKGDQLRAMPAEEFATLVLELLDYDKETGLFTWRNPANPKWLGRIAGCLKKDKGYVEIRVKGAQFKAHRLAWVVTYKKWPSDEIDHINGVRHDNRIANLRDVTKSGNICNLKGAKSNSKSGLLGVWYDRYTKRWESQIALNGKNKHLGRFNTPEEAHQAYLKAKRELHSTCTI